MCDTHILTIMEEILAKFKIVGTPVEVKPLGSGLINDTYLVRTAGDAAPDYVLQRINNAIFTDVELLQHNIEAVTRHLRSKLAGCADVDRRVLRFIATSDGKTFCRDDAGSFLGRYKELDILPKNPFASIDVEGVGQLVEMGVKRGKATNPNLKLGVCGEHGGDPDSIKFFHKVGLTYVSCSAPRVPVARLAAAQAALSE